MIRNKDSIQGNDNKKYDDIINLGRPVSGRQHMSMSDRAAQFASFAALTGYEDAVKETARISEIAVEESVQGVTDPSCPMYVKNTMFHSE